MSIMSMTERVELEKGSRKISEVKELNLDNSKATEIEGLTDQFENLEHLSLVNIGLQSLNALPELPALKKIDLADNRLSGNLENLSKCSKLEQINLSGNEIKTVESITPLKGLLNLRCLDLNNCPVTEIESFRKEVFEMIPNLKYLDGFDENNLEEPVEGVNGPTNGEKPKNTEGNANGDDAEDDYDYDEEEGDEDDESDEEGESDDEEEDYGIAALRNDAELEDDEEDYVPAGEAEDEDFDEDDEDDEALEAETADESGVANLSAAGVTGTRREGAVKRRVPDIQNGNPATVEESGESEDGTPASKKPALATDETTGDSNGTPAEA